MNTWHSATVYRTETKTDITYIEKKTKQNKTELDVYLFGKTPNLSSDRVKQLMTSDFNKSSLPATIGDH